MTLINLRGLELELGGYGPLDYAEGTVTYVDAKGAAVVVNGDALRFPGPVTFTITAGQPDAAIDLPATSATVAALWVVRKGDYEQTRQEFRRLTAIPATGPVDIGALVEVDRKTLAPLAGGAAAWQVFLDGILTQVNTIVAKNQPNGVAGLDANSRILRRQLPIQTVTRLATFGDSMTSLNQGGYAPYGSLVADYLGMAYFNPSVSGERTSDISLRQGGYAPRFTVPGGVIPTTTAEFLVEIAETYTSGFNPAATTKGNIGTFTNVSFLGIPVNLYHVNNTWTMARVAAAPGSNPQPVQVPPAGAYVRDIASAAWRNAVQVYMGGYNGGDQLKDVAMMSAYLENPDQFVLLGIVRGFTGGNPAGYNAEVAKWAAAYPNQFFDMADYVRLYGLSDEGMTPTAQDTADIAAGFVPTSLRRAVDDAHYNAIGQRVIARRLAELLIERGIVQPSPSNRIPPRVAPVAKGLLSLTTTSSLASISPTSTVQGLDALSVRLIDMKIPSLTSTESYRALVSRWQSGNGVWQFLLDGNGKLFFQDANGPAGSQAGAITPLNGVISLRFDVDRAAGTQSFWTSTDSGSTWTQYGSTNTGRSTTWPLSGNSVALLRIGSAGGRQAVVGSTVKRIQILNGSGSVVFDHDFTSVGAGNWTLESGAAIAS